MLPHWITIVIILSSSYSDSVAQIQERLLRNPVSPATWDQYNTDNDFLLSYFSGSTPSTSTSTTKSISSSVLRSKRPNEKEISSKGLIPTTPGPNNAISINKIMETMEQDLIQMIDEEADKLDAFIDNKILEFENTWKFRQNGSMMNVIDHVHRRLENIDKLIEENTNRISARSDTLLDLAEEDKGDDQTKAAVDFVHWLNQLVAKIDEHNIISPTLNKITAFRNRRKRIKIENSAQRRSSDTECGGIIVSDEGVIDYNPEGPDDPCMWTLRVTQRRQISLKLFQNNSTTRYPISNSYLAIYTLTTLPQLYFGFISLKSTGQTGIKGPIILRPGTPEITVDGPLVFIQLISITPNVLPSSFKLAFKSVGPKIDTSSPTTESPIKYNHFHYTDLHGMIDYPGSSGSWMFDQKKVYKGPEIATFTITPQLGANTIKIFVEEIDILEGLFFARGCDQDSLTFFGSNLDHHKYLPMYGKNAEKKALDRYCGKFPEGDVFSINTSEPVIAVFKTDLFFGGRGFKFSWESY